MIFGFIAFIGINSLAGFMIHKGYSGEAVGLIVAELTAGLIAFYKKD
ncbi:MAG: hypothetical protein Q9M94_03755 [Candidatus Gracilibacteria bacterium]|nr:hypothetical protein [Candidatus Gracilibacteria bacterium]